MNCLPAAADPATATLAAAVEVRAPARLHLGFLDPSGTLGRRFGSLGLVIDGFETRVELGAADRDQLAGASGVDDADVERAAEHLHELRRRSGRADPLRLSLLRALPVHAGFGSGTQLALAVGRAFAQWHRLDLDTFTISQWLSRGLRSGIGIAGFEHGGLLVDGGPGGGAGIPAPVLSRIELPSAWRVLVVQDDATRGLSGAAERDAIAGLAPLPRAHAADLCHQVLMRVLPGAASAEFAPFAAGVNRIQRVLGDHFAPAQGGSAFASVAVGRLIDWIAGDSDAGAATGQSSWGPTGFAILPSQAQAEAVVDRARAAGVVDAALALQIVGARSAGATVIDPRDTPRPR